MSIKEYKCNVCVKTYSSYKTLWTHNKQFHDNIKNEIIIENTPTLPITCFVCKNCKKEYKHIQSKNRHEKTCVYVPPISAELELERAKQETAKILQETEKIKQETEKIKRETQEMQLKDDDTVKSINKLLDNAHTAITGNNNVVTNNITNINITFPSIFSGYGGEHKHINVIDTLTYQDKKAIIKSDRSALDKLVEIVHCGEYDFFKNVIITNLTKKYAYKYDESVKNFAKVDKTSLLDDLFEERTMDLESLYNDFAERKRLSSRTRIDFKKFLVDLNNKDELFYDYDKKKYKNYKTYKMDVMNDLLYNKRYKIMDDIMAIIKDWGDKKAIDNVSV